MGFIKILRWRVGGALNSGDGRPRRYQESRLRRAALFIASLGEEHACLLLDELTGDEIRGLISQEAELSSAGVVETVEALQEFLHDLPTDELPSYVPRTDREELARAFVRSNPSAVVERVRDLWLGEVESEAYEPGEDEQILELEYDDLLPPQKAAVFLMWLPSELSAAALREFPSAIVHVVSATMAELPFVTPAARELVLAEYMQGVGLGIPGLSVDDVGLPVVVEAFVRSDLTVAVERITSKWLSGVSLSDLRSRSRRSGGGLSPGEKAAVFFQSLSLPLSYRLLACMEKPEVEGLMDAIDRLGEVGPQTRKEVLRELMMASRGEGAGPQPSDILAKAMAQMIRRRPEVVVRQIRKQWLE